MNAAGTPEPAAGRDGSAGRRPFEYRVGTSGYSFADWVGVFYAERTVPKNMFATYVRHFDTVELNYTFYSMPVARTLDSLARKSPPNFLFWVKANQKITHQFDGSLVPAFVENLQPLADAGKLAGVLAQFEQSFQRTAQNRRFLAGLFDAFDGVPVAAEFRHRSWTHPDTAKGLRDYGITLVIPDVPDIPGLYHAAPAATTRTGYLRLHSRDARKWYGGSTERYNYSYSEGELREFVAEWDKLGKELDRVYAFFNNCHGGQAAQNAEAFRRILEQTHGVPEADGSAGGSPSR